MKKVAIIGGGAAGMFLAVNLKEMSPDIDVTVFESGKRLLRKVKVSGGGRCNCTNSFEDIRDLSAVYPRGHRLMKRLMRNFSHEDAYEWWERHGVRLTTQDDNCVFPLSQDSQEIIDCLVRHAHRYGVRIKTESKIESLEQLSEYDFICIAAGGCTPGIIKLIEKFDNTEYIDNDGNVDILDKIDRINIIEKAQSHRKIEIVPPVPSLFSFSIADSGLRELAGAVVNPSIKLVGTAFQAEGAMLITHWGVSGPAVLKLSSYAARWLNENNYKATLSVNWLNLNEEQTRAVLNDCARGNEKKLIQNCHPPQLSQRLWEFLLSKMSRTSRMSTISTFSTLSKKDRNRLVETLCNDQYEISGRAPFKDEFVTCGGVSLSSVNQNTLESKAIKGLYFAGEVLDIDGITGGFNFQAAWTTAYTVAKSIAASEH